MHLATRSSTLRAIHCLSRPGSSLDPGSYQRQLASGTGWRWLLAGDGLARIRVTIWGHLVDPSPQLACFNVLRLFALSILFFFSPNAEDFIRHDGDRLPLDFHFHLDPLEY